MNPDVIAPENLPRMKTIPATLLAMLAGWALPVLALAAGQLVTSGQTYDVVPVAFWTGLFVFLGWLIVVLPVITRFKDHPLLSSLRLSWLGWSLLGVAAYAFLVVPLMGWTALVIVWYPAAVGAIAGFVFGLLTGRGKRAGDRPVNDLAGGMNPRAKRTT